MKSYEFIVALLLLPIVSISAQTLTFSCTTQAETDLCNALNANAVSCQDNDLCIQCFFQCSLVPTLPPAGTQCANTSCIEGLCIGYALYQNTSLYGSSCNDVYSDEYCAYCGACLGDYGGSNASGNGTNGNSTCDSDYMHLFCRLLPYDFQECGGSYGYIECMKCTGIQELCPSLTLDAVTSEQLDIFCASISICEGLIDIRGPDCLNTDDDLNCKYCDYIDENMNTGLCVTEAPPIECDSQSALACRLINSYNQTCGELLYHPDTCSGCEEFSVCNPIFFNLIGANQTQILCNGGLAENCSTALVSSNCTFNFSAQTCDYCNISNQICMYNESNNGSVTECNFTPDTVMSCFINVTYFPCRALYDSDYCAECENVLDVCSVDAGSGFPLDLCDNSDYVGTCSLIANLTAEECSKHISSFQCEVCQTVNTTCASVSGALDYLCSNEVSCLCSAIITPDGSCFEYASNSECAFCKANTYICSNNIDSNYNCIFNESQCQGIYNSLTEIGSCNSSYSTLQCAYCLSIRDGSGTGSGNNTQPIEGSGSTECTSEITQFCTDILLNSSCNITYGEDCSFCENYLPNCSEVKANQTFCSSSFNILVCSAIPIGPACDRDEHGFLCNLCTYYVENCTTEICSDEELVTSCRNVLIEGSTPNLEYETEVVCLPCSIIFQLCPNIVVVISSVMPSVSIVGSSSYYESVTSITSSYPYEATTSMPAISPQMSFSTMYTSLSSLTSSSSSETNSFTSSNVQVNSTTTLSSATSISSVSFTLSTNSLSSTSTSKYESTSIDSPTATSIATNTIATTVYSISTDSTTIAANTTISASTMISASTTIAASTTMTASTTITASTSTVSTATATFMTTSAITSTDTMKTTTATSVHTITTTSSLRPSETPTLPPSSTRTIEELSDVEMENSVTIELINLSKLDFIASSTAFAQAVAHAINLQLSKRRQISSVMTEDVKIVEDLIIEKGQNLDVAFYVEGDTPDTPIPQSLVVRAVNASRDTISSSAGAAGIADIKEGLFLSSTSPSTGLSNGAVAAIVIVIVLVVLVLSIVVVAVIGVVYYKQFHSKGRYIIAQSIEFSDNLKKPSSTTSETTDDDDDTNV